MTNTRWAAQCHLLLSQTHLFLSQVFNNPDASDPSHSLLSKDHFGLILNEPAGKTALVVVRYSVKLIVDVCPNPLGVGGSH